MNYVDMYYKPYKSGYYQIQNTIILKSVKTLKELPSNDALPKIPIDINSVEFLPQKSDSLSVNTDIFFEHTSSSLPSVEHIFLFLAIFLSS
jgi:hypothetical protein